MYVLFLCLIHVFFFSFLIGLSLSRRRGPPSFGGDEWMGELDGVASHTAPSIHLSLSLLQHFLSFISFISLHATLDVNFFPCDIEVTSLGTEWAGWQGQGNGGAGSIRPVIKRCCKMPRDSLLSVGIHYAARR